MVKYGMLNIWFCTSCSSHNPKEALRHILQTETPICRADFLFRLAVPWKVFKEPIAVLLTLSIFIYICMLSIQKSKNTVKVFWEHLTVFCKREMLSIWLKV